MTEDQQDLGNGQWGVTLMLSADTDMAPGDTIAFSFGHEDAVDLLQPVSLQSICQPAEHLAEGLRHQCPGQSISTDNEVLSLLSPQYRAPWTGAVADPPGASIARAGINWDVRSASYEMIVHSVPEPALPTLIGCALAAQAITRRRSGRRLSTYRLSTYR